MKKVPDSVAVHIVTYNNEKTIGPCLTALKKQSFPGIIVCIIDNNSQDETVAIVKNFRPDNFIRNAKNLGYAAAHNQALHRTKSTYVLTLNPDVVLDPRFIEQMVKAFQSSPSRVGSAAGLLLRVDTIDGQSHVVDGAGLGVKANRRQFLRYEGQKIYTVPSRVTTIFGPDGSAAFYKRAMLNDIDLGDGIFDESFFMHKEDVDVCWRAQLRGWTSLFVPTARANHIRFFRAGKRHGIDPVMKSIAVRNRYFLMTKNELPLLFLRDFLWIGLYDFGILLYLLLQERSSLIALAQYRAALSDVLKKRRSIQRKRTVPQSYMAQWFVWSAT